MDKRSFEVNEVVMTYRDYLQSDAWRDKRFSAFNRCGRKCQLCGKPLKPQGGWHCHHNSYAHLGNELDHELTVLCIPCHEGFHRKFKPKKKKKPKQRVQMLTASERRKRGGKGFVMVNV